MKLHFFWAGVFLTIVQAMFGQERSQSPVSAEFDVIIRGGTVYDGSGTEPRQADVALLA
jgi:hypothetical protein